MIEAMIFDVGGVLINNDTSTKQEVKSALGLNDGAIDQIWTALIPQLGSGKIDEATFWSQISKEFGTRDVSPGENLLGQAFATNITKNDGVYEYAAKLAQRGVKLAILSDTIEPHARAMREAGIFTGFDNVFLSYEIGHRKPSQEAFSTVAESLQIEPVRIGFTDDIQANIDGARGIGMKATQFTTIDNLISIVDSW